MNLPFSLLDILERLMPGGIFLATLIIMPASFLTLDEPSSLISTGALGKDILLASLFTAASYALGVLFNLLAGIIRPLDEKYLDRRDEVPPETTSEKDSKMDAAFLDVFGFERTKESWRLCYGIVEKSGFGIRVDIFSSLNMFCRSMMVAVFFLFAIYAVELVWDQSIVRIVIPFILLALSALFAYGAAIFSNVFSAAILEAFLTWYSVTAHESKLTKSTDG